MHDANFFAPVVFWGSVPMVLWLFRTYPPAKACALSLLGASLFLPELYSVDPPLFPAFDKITLPPLAALAGALIWARRRLARPFQPIDRVIVALAFGAVITVLNNDFPVAYAEGIELPLVPFDILSLWIRDFLTLYCAFFLGRSLFRTREDLHLFARMLAASGLIYSVLLLFEARMSPQLHNWTYGYHQHRFDQTFRFGGWRPMVYMSHGLTCSRYMLGTLIAMAAVARARRRVWGLPSWVWVVYLVIVLGFARSAGAWVLGAIAVPLVTFTTPKTQLRFATAVAAFVLTYPILRAADLVPVDAAVDWASQNISVERAESLEDRFEQEELLLDKLRQHWMFGWGPRRYSLWDEAAKEWATIDGEWLHTFGKRGMWGFFCEFAIYLAPVWIARKHLRRLRPADAQLVAGLTVLQAVFTLDNIPNSSGALPMYFIAGVLYGAVGGVARQTTLEARERRRQALAERQASEQASTA